MPLFHDMHAVSVALLLAARQLYIKVTRPCMCPEELTRQTRRRRTLPYPLQGTDDETWSPATIFVVSDHLHHLLVRNMFRRDPTPGAARS